MSWEDTVLSVTKLESIKEQNRGNSILPLHHVVAQIQAKASYEAGVKAEHERVRKCVKFTVIDQDTYAIMDMMQFEYPELCPKKEAKIKDASEVTGIWERDEP